MEGISLIEAKHESRLQLWRSRVMECRSSGKSVTVWCKENGINVKTCYYWQKKVWDKNNIIPFIIEDNKKSFYYRGLSEWRNERGRLVDTCLDGQDTFIRLLDMLDISHDN